MFERGTFILVASFLISIFSGVAITWTYLFLSLLVQIKRNVPDEDQSWGVMISRKDFILMSVAIGVIIWLVWLGIDRWRRPLS